LILKIFKPGNYSERPGPNCWFFKFFEKNPELMVILFRTLNIKKTWNLGSFNFENQNFENLGLWVL
jgi:hypothetical protein